MTAKKLAAEKAAAFVRDGMVVGLGSGTTAAYAIQAIGQRVAGGMNIKAVASSVASEQIANEWSIPVIDPSDADSIDIAIDGADEVDKEGNLIKGGGGSLLREKVIAFASQAFYVIIEDSKLVGQLGRKALPVEVVPFGMAHTLRHISRLGAQPHVRQESGRNFVTDNGNFIVDCLFGEIDDPTTLDVKLKMIPGVIETGLFLSQIVTGIVIGFENGETRVISLNP